MLSLNLPLHLKQSDAYHSNATEILFGGAAGGGKSHLLRAAAIAWACQIEGLQVYLFRRTHPDLRENHMTGAMGFPSLLAELVNEGFAKINHSTHQITFKGGSCIHLCHCQHAKDVWSFQGAEMHVLMIDELTQWEEEMYTFLRSRCRMANVNIPDEFKGQFPRIICGANPGGIGHNWVKAFWVSQGLPNSYHQMAKPDGGMLRQYIPSRLEDNPTLIETDPDYEYRLEGLGSAELVRAMRLGDWDIVAGGFFDDVWRDHRDQIVVKAFKIPGSWRIDRSFDWGSSAPFSVGWWAESDGSDVDLPDGTKRHTKRGDIFRISEWYGWDGKPNKGCRMLARDIATGILQREREMGLQGRVRKGPADSSIYSKQDGHSIADEMAKAGVHWTESDKSPGSRKNGWQRMRELFRGAGSVELPGLYVFDNCTHFIRTVPTLPRSDRDQEDVDTAAEDHIADESRYRLYQKRHLSAVGHMRGN